MAIDVRFLTHDLDFVPITSLPKESILKVLDIRNQNGVRNNMYTDHEITRDEHLAWVERLRSSTDTHFFVVIRRGDIIGGASLSGLNRAHRRADWAFYLSEESQGRGVGASLEYHFVTMAFDAFGIEKLNCEVISFNERVVKLHQKFGFQIEGIRRDHVIRNGQKFDTVLLGITKEEWESQWNEQLPQRHHRPNRGGTLEKQQELDGSPSAGIQARS